MNLKAQLFFYPLLFMFLPRSTALLKMNFSLIIKYLLSEMADSGEHVKDIWF